ncbi:Para-aminobenzoate synthase, aminase component [Liberibacter crescens BT-1]|uniref:Para-aminobenzoate synthase, aminase component n=1 Tax=Liberibacter crescens (strain BT-1) TaxID=1215343 RepID=L0EST6_LIBCB|nr:aminodeoxychorismate synthase component I [Liberibacter crescens]AGA64574.1 Para-aminobenzoate synthase, aminase component [Liberibacter crescens BT-1]AMC13344.1 aminodeoxychorismate synthase [Liberibacter crescens]
MVSLKLDKDPFILLCDDWKRKNLLFTEPKEIICARNEEDLWKAFSYLEEARLAGKWLAGYISYEAGFLFEKRLKPLASFNRKTPLLCFGIFDKPVFQNYNQQLLKYSKEVLTESFLKDLHVTWSFDVYQKKFQQFHQSLQRGDSFQGNLTMPITASWTGDPLAVFFSLINYQPVPYGAFIAMEEPLILSRSPELFFRIDNNLQIETRPMKGTMPRGKTISEDQEIIENLRTDVKNLAENRMIVDLLRNDISRISLEETLQTPDLFKIETYTTVHQMVSSVRGQLKKNLSIKDIFSALFPCGSVTGVPKIRTMELLHGIEEEPRDVYCGAIGFISPQNTMCFSVAIRTLSLFRQNKAVLNVGSGIVYDSNAWQEYQECLLKARFAMMNKTSDCSYPDDFFQ